MNTKYLVNEIESHIVSILEDLNYGADVNKEQKVKLEEINSFLEDVAAYVAMQNLVEPTDA
ncbi:MAG TPA: hypothetical protein DEG69_15425 [Flavobacteriaceae bacterium]|nr:hypothetical protein [Flavobacteriaceae bacterium]